MKKRLLLLLICLLFTVSCTACGQEGYLDPANYDETFRENNRALFYHPSCDHALVYSAITDSEDPTLPNLYHVAKCKWGNCDYREALEPHSFKAEYLSVNNAPQYKENGYLYHSMLETCTGCRERIRIYVLCKRQDPDCCKPGTALAGDDCHKDSDWREILCDTPYEILYD